MKLTDNAVEIISKADIRNKVFLLDIDGVLTENQAPLSDIMQQHLQQIARHFKVYFVTGNSYTKTVDILNGPIKDFHGVFCNNADELRTMRGKLVWTGDTVDPLPVQIEDTLRCLLTDDEHYGNRIEWRNPRMLNFSRIGRFAPGDVRKAHDASWRQDTIDFLKVGYPNVEAVAGGSISLDIYSKGADKSRACKYIKEQGHDFIFIGDKTSPGGNDHCVNTFCESSEKDLCLTTSGPTNTLEMIDLILKRV